MKTITSASTSTTTVPATTTVAVTTCAMGGSCAVGDTGPGGGIVFYDAGSTQSWGRYLEVACAGWQNNCDGSADPPAVWGCDGTDLFGAGGTAIGTGKENTADIVIGCAESGIAADRADDYSNAGQIDWFLPSKNELNALCKWAYGDTVNVVCNDGGNGSFSLTYGGFSTSSYWSSSDADDGLAWYQYFGFGSQSNYGKLNSYSVRPVRAF